MISNLPVFREPTTVEKIFNRTFGYLVGLGLGPSHIYLLEVRGRKSGKLFSTPVDLLELQGTRYLVAPRGRTQWVRNAEAAGEITLKRGSARQKFRLRRNSRCRQTADPEGLPRQLQARSATLFSSSSRIARGSFRRGSFQLPRLRASTYLNLPAIFRITTNVFRKQQISACIKLKVMASSNILKRKDAQICQNLRTNR